MSCFKGKYHDELIANAAYIGTPGKGILAADESTGTIGKRLSSINLRLSLDVHANPLRNETWTHKSYTCTYNPDDKFDCAPRIGSWALPLVYTQDCNTPQIRFLSSFCSTLPSPFLDVYQRQLSGSENVTLFI
ncbi:Fructose-bisphosphate aldolase, class-I [Dillenia turbinata]|uniref:fructose-bisphosphate aldolase n=1 Tax=Dillenia turbinata TaxID=194707 RepID=A0AAN8ZG22_9MAGN